MGDIINASAVTAYFGFPSGDLAVLSGLCNRVDDILAGICNRPNGFLSAAQTEVFDADFNDRFVLTYTPIAASPAPVITADGQTVSSDLYTIINKSGIVGMNDSATVLWSFGQVMTTFPPINRVNEPNFGYGFQSISVAYTGGYGVIPIPGDLVQAALEMVGHLYRQRTRDTTLQSERLGDYSYANQSGNEWRDFIDRIKVTYLEPGGHIRHNLM